MDEQAMYRRARRGATPTLLRDHNERVILTLLREHGELAKSELARLTDLSLQTVSVIMRALEEEGILLRGTPVRGRVGQPSVPMTLAPDGAYFLGLKAGRRSTDLVMTDFSGRVHARRSRTYRYPEPVTITRFAGAALAEIAEDKPEEYARVAGLGIAIPFWLWNWAKPLNVPQAEMDVWRDTDLRAEIAEMVDFPVYLENDATAACSGELTFGDDRQLRHFLYFYVGYFIGGGVVLDRTLYTGPSGNSGAFGPLPVLDGGKLVPLLDVASLSTLEAELQAAGHATEAMWETPATWDLSSPILDGWIERAGAGIAQAIAAAGSVIDFENALIDGWISDRVRDALVARVRQFLGTMNLTGIAVPDVRPGSVGPDARALGAASVPLRARFLVDLSQ